MESTDFFIKLCEEETTQFDLFSDNEIKFVCPQKGCKMYKRSAQYYFHAMKIGANNLKHSRSANPFSLSCLTFENVEGSLIFRDESFVF